MNTPFPVVVVSPNAPLRQQIQEKLVPERWRVFEAGNGAVALKLLDERDSHGCVLLLDPMLLDRELEGFRTLLAERFPDVEVLMLHPQTGQVLMNTKPTPVSSQLVATINGSAARASIVPLSSGIRQWQRDPHNVRLRGMIGKAASLQHIWSLTRTVAPLPTTVLISGESGTGKELLAQEIHLISTRRNQPFVVVNCSSVAESLLEAELFGYTKWSFTGARQSSLGRIHAAHGGTLFLNEIGDMPLSLQSKLLRFFEHGEVRRLGGTYELKVDVRVIAATRNDLQKQVANQQFREDLYHWLAVFPLHLPPLRERMEDLEDLAQSLASKFLPGATVSRPALQILAQHSWPGNIRELRIVIERATILVGAGREIRPEHILL